VYDRPLFMYPTAGAQTWLAAHTLGAMLGKHSSEYLLFVFILLLGRSGEVPIPDSKHSNDPTNDGVVGGAVGGSIC